MRRPTISHRVEYWLVRGVEAATGALPEQVTDRAGAAIGGLIHRPARIRLATVHGNLRRAFPGATAQWTHRTAREAYRHLGREAVATMRLAGMTAAEVIDRTDVHGWEAFQDAFSEGRGAILMTGHFGNWEIGAAAIAARGVPFSAVVQRQSNPLVDAHLDATRHRLGVETIRRGDAMRGVPRALRAGRAVGIVGDQDAGRSGVWVPFLGVPSSTYRGPALFALRANAPIFASAAFRVPGAMRYRIELEPVEVSRSGDLARDVVGLTAAVNARLEATIRRAPEQYFWLHRRWKTPRPAELDPPSPGTTASGDEVVQLEKPR